MLSIKEMVDKTTEQRKTVEDVLDRGYYDWNEASLLRGQGGEDRQQIMETMRTIKLADLVKRSGDDAPYLNRGRIKEFLASSGTSGIAGAYYLIPEKVYQVMFDSAVQADVCADISIAMIPPDQIPGQAMRVAIAKDDSYAVKKMSSGGKMSTETIETVKSDFDFTTIMYINFMIANDLIEDAQFDVIEMHLRNAGREMGEQASVEALTILSTAPDGDGTLNSGTTNTANITKWTGDTTIDIEAAILLNLVDGFLSDTIAVSHSAMLDDIYSTVPNYGQPWMGSILGSREGGGGWPTQIMGMNIVYSDCSVLSISGANVTCVFAKDYGILTGRKRWLRIEKYSDPIRDLVGATITSRQDSVSVYKDAICTITES